MATYKITINERTKEGRELIAAIRKSKVTEFNRDDLKISDPTEMTKAQFYAKIDRALASRNVTEVKPEELDEFLARL